MLTLTSKNIALSKLAIKKPDQQSQSKVSKYAMKVINPF